MTLSYIVGGVGVAYAVYGLIKKEFGFSLSELGVVLITVLMNQPPLS